MSRTLIAIVISLVATPALAAPSDPTSPPMSREQLDAPDYLQSFSDELADRGTQRRDRLQTLRVHAKEVAEASRRESILFTRALRPVWTESAVVTASLLAFKSFPLGNLGKGPVVARFDGLR